MTAAQTSRPAEGPKRRWHEPVTAHRGLLSAYDSPPGQRLAAALKVCQAAASVDEARLMLDALGLLDPPPRAQPLHSRSTAAPQPVHSPIHTPQRAPAEPWMRKEQTPQLPGQHRNPPRPTLYAEVMAAPQTWDEWMTERARQRTGDADGTPVDVPCGQNEGE